MADHLHTVEITATDQGKERCAACGRPRFSDRHLAQVTRERDEARARVAELEGWKTRALTVGRAVWRSRAHWIATADFIRRHARAEIAELGTVLADRAAEGIGIKGMTIGPNGVELAMAPTTEEARRLVLAMAMACGRILDDDQAPNYIEFEAGPAGQPGYVVHVRRAGGPSPHTLRVAAEARAEKAEARIAELEGAEPSGYAVGAHLGEGAAPLIEEVFPTEEQAHGLALELIRECGWDVARTRVYELREVTDRG